MHASIPDDLLDDLQTTVTRTADHLNKSRSRDVQYLSPSNTTTVVHERSVSPGGVRINYCVYFQIETLTYLF